MKDPSESRFRKTDQVAARRIDDEVLLVPVRTDPRQKLGIYTLNRTAAFIWEQLDGSSPEELVEQVCARFQVSPEVARKDLATILDHLLDMQAIEHKEGT